jgi:SIR2-like domain
MEQKVMNNLLNHVQKKKCILVLGPEFINIDKDESATVRSILDFLADEQFKPYITDSNFLGEDGFFFFNENQNQDRIAKESMLHDMSEYFKGLDITESYEKLAQIPFDAVISLSPDKLLLEASLLIGKSVRYQKYSAAGFQDDPDNIPGQPVLYNLCGDIDEEDILLFTFDNLFKFLDKLFQNSNFPNFKERICQAKTFIFLGFSYDKWYMKLIFYMIKKMRYTAPGEVKYAVMDYDKKPQHQKIGFFQCHFGMLFTSGNEKAFIGELYDACKTAGILFEDQPVEEQRDGADKKYRIMYLAASPQTKPALRQGAEYYKGIKQMLDAKLFDTLEPIFNVSTDKLRAAVNKNNPELVFLSCHGTSERELILANAANFPEYLSLKDLLILVKHLVKVNRRLQCIVFSSCQSEEQAKQISTIVPYCIGMRIDIKEAAADTFTQGFFEGFVKRNAEIEYAFANGLLALKATPFGEDKATYENIPRLYHKGTLITPEI